MRTIRAVLETSVRMYSNRIALQFGGERLTYHQLYDHVTNVACHLKVLGITPDDTVVLLFQNTPACVIGFLALAWLSTSVIPLEPASPYELESTLEDAKFSAVLGCDLTLSRLKSLRCRYDCSFIDIMELLPRPCVGLIPSEPLPSDRAFIYHYTSGSMGKPKAALHSQVNLISGGIIYRQTYHIQPEDSILAAVPLMHSYGMGGGLASSLVSGSRLVLVERFVPNQLVQTLSAERITILLAVPFMYDMMARCHLRGTPDLSALRVCLSSGARLLPDVAQCFRNRFHKPIYQIYGSTETGIIASQWPRDQGWPEHSVGCPVMGSYVRIVDENGRNLPASEVGSLLVRTPAMFAGYSNHPDATARAFQDGWYVTGDMAWQDVQDCLYLIGRKDTFINVAGKKVNPLEVEEVLLCHPKVREAVVFGSDAGSGGECVQAAVVLRGEASEAKLIAFCRERLAPYKVPGHIESSSELPRVGLGKVRRAVPVP